MQSIPNQTLNRREDGKPSETAEKELRSIHIKMKSNINPNDHSSQLSSEQRKIVSHPPSIDVNRKQDSQSGFLNAEGQLIQNPPYFAVHDNRDSSVVVEIGSKFQNNTFEDNFQQNQITKIQQKSVEQNIQASENRLVATKYNIDCTILCLFFTLLVGCGIVLFVLTEQIWLLIVACILYAFECVLTGFLQIFYTPITQEEFNQLYEELIHDDPCISMKASSFITKNKSKKQETLAQAVSNSVKSGEATTIAQKIQQISSSSSNSKSQDYVQVREEVFSEQRSFDFKQSVDFSHPLHKQAMFFENEGILYIELIVNWKCANQATKDAFIKLKTEVISNAKSRSEDITFSEISRVVQFPTSKKCLVYRTSHFKSKLFNMTAYTIFSVFLFSFFYRLYYLNTIKTLQLHIAKMISV